MTHHRESSPSSRLRHWASRLALLVACASVVATSQAISDDVFSDPYSGAPATLTTEAPKTRIPLVVLATASKSPDKIVEAELTVLVTATWRPADPSQTEGPWLRAVLVEGETEFSGPEAGILLLAGAPVTTEVQTYLSRECRLGSTCEWTANLDLELPPGAPAGKVELVWTATAQAHVVDTSSTPKGFKVIVSEP
ncbi:hypothetical protein D7W79_00885 [Corallococcus exercitus]|uniref:Uncharacterized protein n=1 Tax=Corallococcus exercitus TaxID=2316736 RepID=A0A3A8IKT0_9BACT|nr:hypothetical protein [Corallococcus exercitus]NOK34860.1 hypothetical protein [Corallococcus exercitus]RKG83066.1 hypothetical protein D7W79_00885 [Corallococcus exercitus]